MSVEDNLLKLNELKGKGAITAEEFEARKAHLLKLPAKRLNMREAFNQSQVVRTEKLSVIEIQNATEIYP